MQSFKIQYFPFILFLISCGNSQEQIAEKNNKKQDSLQTFALDSTKIYRNDSVQNFKKDSIFDFKERERVHLEKIEVGKAILKTELDNSIERMKQSLTREEKKLLQIDAFQLGRSLSTKEMQMTEQRAVIIELKSAIGNLQSESALTNLHQTYEFQSNPTGLVKHLFWAAENKDFTKLRHLIDPYGEYDSDVKGLLFVEAFPIEKQDERVSNFKEGRIMSEPKVDGDLATVEIAYGISSNQLEVMNLVRRMDKWYFKSF